MEMEDIQTSTCKFSRVGNGRSDSNQIGQKDDEEDGEIRRGGGGVGGGSNGSEVGGGGRLRGWHHSSRIIRVSRASGGKDRHSKVWTSRGLRDRRIRLSVTTAIQFYDLQDRLGYDQPSKAVDWLIKAAAEPIKELPSLNNSFPNTPKQPSDEKRPGEQGFDSADIELVGESNLQHQQHQHQHLSMSKSACSSTSETSRGSGLSLSRSELHVNRVKARERARERTAKEKEKEKESDSHHHNVNPISHNASFTELLTGGIGGASTSPASAAAAAAPAQQTRQWSSTPMDYFNTGLLGPLCSRTHQQIHLGNSLPQSMAVPAFNPVGGGDHHPELPHFALVPEHLFLASQSAAEGDCNLNFTISSSLAGFNRGTLQSNSPSLLPHLQRFSSPIDGSNLPFFVGANAPMENHHHHHHHNHQFPPGFDGRLQLCYGDGGRHSDQKEKGKN